MEDAGPDDLRLADARSDQPDQIEHTQGEALFEGSGTSSPGVAPLALYRRYRPDTFAEVIGQDHVTEPLQRALTNNRVVEMDPMSAQERRVIHERLKDRSGVETYSEGDEPRRCVIVAPLLPE